MHAILALVLLGHGLSHLVGFLVGWHLLPPERMPAVTTVWSGRLQVGAVGMKLLGLLWLLLTLAFVVAALGAFLRVGFWPPFTQVVALASLTMCLIEGSEARIGVIMNVLLIGFLGLAMRFGWPIVQ